jgi:plasmid stabilization system protein ParE
MTRHVVISAQVAAKFDDVVDYLKDELKFSEAAATAYYRRFFVFLSSLGVEVDYALCRFRKWRTLGYRCAVFEKGWVVAYETVDGGVIIRDMMHGKLLVE